MKISQGYMDKLLVNVKAGETTVLEIQTKPQGYVLDEKAQSASIEIELYEDKGSESTPMTSSTVSVKLLESKEDRKNKQNRQELIFQKVKDNSYRLDGIIPGEYFILVDNFPGDSESVECANLNVTKGRIYESDHELKLYDLDGYIRRIEEEKKYKYNPLEDAFLDGKFDSGVHRDAKTPPVVPWILEKDLFEKKKRLAKYEKIKVEQILYDIVRADGHIQILKVNINNHMDQDIFLFGAVKGKTAIKENGFEYTVKSGYQKLKIFLKKEEIGHIISRWEPYEDIPSDSLELLIEVPSTGAVKTQGVFSVLNSIPQGKLDNEEFPYNIKDFDYTVENFRCQIPIDDQSKNGVFVRIRSHKSKVLDKTDQDRIKKLTENKAKDAVFSPYLYPTEEMFARIFVFKNNSNTSQREDYMKFKKANSGIQPGINKIFMHLDKDGKLIEYNIDEVDT